MKVEHSQMKLKSLAWIGLWFFSASALGQSWTIGNAQIERRITFDPAAGLFTARLTDVSTHYDFVPDEKRPAQEFSFVCNGETLAGASSAFQLLRADESKLADGKLLTVH